MSHDDFANLQIRMVQTMKELRDTTEDIRVARNHAITAKEALVLAEARAFLNQGDDTVEAKKHKMVLACADERLDSQIAAATLTGLRERAALLRDEFDTLRSVSSLAKLEAQIGRETT